jgi:CheY-like chemotaxis protein
MDGFEATVAIRALEEGTDRHTPIVAMTAHAMQGDRQRCLESGMDGYVSKPVRAHELFEAIDAVVNRSSTNGGPNGTAIAEPAAAAAPSLDWDAAVARLRGDEDLLRELAGLFLEECPKCRAEIAGDRDIHSLLNAITMQMGPQVMLAIKVRMRAGLSLNAAVASLNALEKRIKAKFPEVAWCFVEPDTSD